MTAAAVRDAVVAALVHPMTMKELVRAVGERYEVVYAAVRKLEDKGSVRSATASTLLVWRAEDA